MFASTAMTGGRQPMGQPTHSWTIADAATGVRETGKIVVKDLLELQPWPPMPTS
jgi:hypothetical protein